MSAASVQQNPEVKIKLSVVKGPHKGQVFSLNKPSFTIGRGAENDVILMNDPLVSRLHAQVDIVDRDLEIKNLSSKNLILVQGESVQQWKLVSNSNFTIGESEMTVEYDLGKAIALVESKNPVIQKSNVLPLNSKTNSNMQKTTGTPQGQYLPPHRNNQFNNHRNNQSNNSVEGSPDQSKLIYFLIGVILIGSLSYYFLKPNKTTKLKKQTSILKYEDTVNLKLSSTKEAEREAEREDRSRNKQKSPQDFRIRESFVRGMRDYQLGNYIRAGESFQLILNLDPDHALAKRYAYLAKVRFDEIVQEKLMLGESYFKKHNFGMCESLYKQVIDMLSEKKDDLKNQATIQLAAKKSRQCQLADEGIR